MTKIDSGGAPADMNAMAARRGIGSDNGDSDECQTMTITVANESCLCRSWPSSSVGVMLLLAAGTALAFPIWALLLAKYREERDSLVAIQDSSTIDTFVMILDAASQWVLETAPRMVARVFTFYVGLCCGCVGLAKFGYTLRNEKMRQQ